MRRSVRGSHALPPSALALGLMLGGCGATTTSFSAASSATSMGSACASPQHTSAARPDIRSVVGMVTARRTSQALLLTGTGGGKVETYAWSAGDWHDRGGAPLGDVGTDLVSGDAVIVQWTHGDGHVVTSTWSGTTWRTLTTRDDLGIPSGVLLQDPRSGALLLTTTMGTYTWSGSDWTSTAQAPASTQSSWHLSPADDLEVEFTDQGTSGRTVDAKWAGGSWSPVDAGTFESDSVNGVTPPDATHIARDPRGKTTVAYASKRTEALRAGRWASADLPAAPVELYALTWDPTSGCALAVSPTGLTAGGSVDETHSSTWAWDGTAWHDLLSITPPAP